MKARKRFCFFRRRSFGHVRNKLILRIGAVLVILCFLSVASIQSGRPNSTSIQAETEKKTTSSSEIPEIIKWRPDLTLTWDFFQGEVPENASDNAQISLKLEISAKYEYFYEFSSGLYKCTARLANIQASALMNTRKSWVRPKQKSEFVRAHEQIHFDMYGLHALQLQNELNSYLDMSHSQTGTTEEEAQSKAMAYLESIIQSVVDRYEHQLDLESERFDQDIHENKARQNDWINKVEAQITQELSPSGQRGDQ